MRSGDFVSGVAAKGTPKGASSAAKRKSKDEGVDGADDAGTPSKKAKATEKKSAKAKQEAVSEEDEDDSVAARKDTAEGRDGDEGEDED